MKLHHSGIHFSHLTLAAAVALWACLALVGGTRAGEAAKLPNLPKGITSFGAAVMGHDLYVYGGHWGAAHGYAQEDQSNEFWKLSLDGSKGWQQLESGPRLTGLALVAHGGKLYRVGGFQARNKDGEAQNLWSLAEAACYDPQSGRWTPLPDMPAPRSSHDAAVLDDTLYVFGGWSLQGPDKSTWHTTGCALDLKQPTAGWRTIDKVPFQRRALSVTAHRGQVYVIGGMQNSGGPTTAVDVYEPATGEWHAGPKLPAEKEFEGFGNSSASSGSHLLVATHSGDAYRLSGDGTAWQPAGKLQHPRFFHRLLPLGSAEFVALGGAHMGSGKILEVERLAATSAAAEPAR